MNTKKNGVSLLYIDLNSPGPACRGLLAARLTAENADKYQHNEEEATNRARVDGARHLLPTELDHTGQCLVAVVSGRRCMYAKCKKCYNIDINNYPGVFVLMYSSI